MATLSSSVEDPVQGWLNEVGFVYHPFRGVSAEWDENLEEHFIQHPSFDMIRGLDSVALFAPQGSGKTSNRLMLERRCLKGYCKEDVFPIRYTDFSRLVNNLPAISLEAHMECILRVATSTLFDFLVKHLYLFFALSDLDRELLGYYLMRYPSGERWGYRLKRAMDERGISLEILSGLKEATRSKELDREMFEWAMWEKKMAHERKMLEIHVDNLHLLEEQEAKSGSDSSLKLQNDIKNEKKQIGCREEKIKQLENEKVPEPVGEGEVDSLESMRGDPLVEFAMDVAQMEPHPPSIFTDYVSYLDLLKGFSRITEALNFKAIFILIDGVDKYPETKSPQGIDNCLKHLFDTIDLLCIPDIYFKFFLPLEMKNRLMQYRGVKTGRVRVPPPITWTEEELSELLRSRLGMASAQFTELRAITEENFNEKIDKALINAAAGSPRKLLLLGEEIVRIRAHAWAVNQRDSLLTERDFNETLNKLEYLLC